MNILRLLSKSRGSRNLLVRIFTILCRFGITATRFKHLLNRYVAATSSLGCTPTFAITAVTLKRHPKIIRELHRQGAEFSIHGYIHTDYRFVQFERQTQHIKKAIKVFESSQIPFTGFRAPFLRINGNTPEVLGRLEFQYDSSHVILWDVLDQAKYQKQSWHEYERLLQFYLPQKAKTNLALPRFINGFIEIPVSIPDDEAMVDRLRIKDEKQISRAWLSILQQIYDRGELFTIQLHPERISFCETALVGILEQAKKLNPPVWVATLGEIADWWRERNQFSLEIDAKGGGKYRIKAECTERATLLIKNCKANTPVTEWSNGYQSISTRDFILESALFPAIGVSPGTSPAAIKFLQTEGFVVKQDSKPEKYGLYLSNLEQFTEADEKSLSEKIEQSNVPLIRYWRWPNRARSAISITGDIDSITVVDFVLRIFENWWNNQHWRFPLWEGFTRKAHYAVLLLKIGGLKAFLRQLGRQIYSRDILLGMEKYLKGKNKPYSSRVEYSLELGTEEDLQEVLVKSRTESKESVHELLQRKWFYDCGFHECYVGRISDTGELCHIQWFVPSEVDGKVLKDFRSRLPQLKNDEILIENVYTFEKYRRNRIMLSVTSALCDLARDKGVNRAIAYVRRDNIAALEGFEKAGFKKFEEIPELKFLFHTRRKHDRGRSLQ